jgi:hypothetical protein
MYWWISLEKRQLNRLLNFLFASSRSIFECLVNQHSFFWHTKHLFRSILIGSRWEISRDGILMVSSIDKKRLIKIWISLLMRDYWWSKIVNKIRQWIAWSIASLLTREDVLTSINEFVMNKSFWFELWIEFMLQMT